MAKAKYFLLTGKPISGDEAERIGLVSLCVSDSDLDGVANTVAAELAGGAQQALRWTKQILNHWYKSFGPTFDASLALEMYSFSGPEARQGFEALRGRAGGPG
jgi:enoyl-CoA hydratase